MIDETDREILKILQQNARIPNAEIARQVGMAPSAILERIRKLESRGVIQGYEARLNPEALGLGLLAYVAVRSTDMSSELRTGQLLAAVEGVQEVHHIAGEDCFLIKVRARDARTLGQLLRERIGATGGVVFTRTTIVLETLHETSLLPLDGVVGAMGAMGAIGAVGAVGAMGGAAPVAAAGETPARGERPEAPRPESIPAPAAAGLAIMATGGAGRPGRS